jgi:non-heme chloroperoxidase
MPYLKVGSEDSAEIEIHYNHHGAGKPVVPAADASPYASYACVDTWLTDFRADLPKIDVPTLVVHGTADRILPFQATAARLRDEQLIEDLTVVEVADGPHNIGWTHPDELNSALLEFLPR